MPLVSFGRFKVRVSEKTETCPAAAAPGIPDHNPVNLLLVLTAADGLAAL